MQPPLLSLLMRKGKWFGKHRDLKEGVVVRKGVEQAGGVMSLMGSDDVEAVPG